MKINRLLAITFALLNKGPVTAGSLANRFEVSTRTIYRDIEALSSAGIPVYTNKGRGGGIALMKEYTLDKALISEKEGQNLLIALKALEATNYPDLDSIAEKFRAIFKSTAPYDWIEIDFSGWGSRPDQDKRFSDIRRAILQHRVISFEYLNSQGKKSLREVEPEKLHYRGYSWYLTGYCRLRREPRIFRISRIKKVQVKDESFIPRIHPGNLTDDLTGYSRDMVTLKLRFQPEALYRLYDDFDEESIKINIDGTFDVTIAFPEDEWVYGYILGFGNYVEVIEPARIRQIIKNRLQKTLTFYKV